MKYSRQYNYVRSRQLEGTYPGDPKTGAWGSTSLRVGKGWGWPLESEWPYDGDAAHWPPVEPPDMDIKAKANRILAYERARTIDECRTLLAAEIPITAAFEIDESWSHPKEGVIPAPATQTISGSHAILLCGYNDNEQRFIFANSWGVGWGDKGFGYLPYDYFPKRFLEAWSIIVPKMPPIPTGSSGVEWRTWGIHDPLGGLLHGIEVVDLSADELIGWGFAVERDAFLDIEELFVRPKWRNQGYASRMATEFIKLSTRLGRHLRAWIPHSDCNKRNLSALKAVLRHLGLSVQSSPERWAGAIGR
jgi:GNAT superfamily N-acetyltransferase